MLLDYDALSQKYDMHITGIVHIGAHQGQEYSLYRSNENVGEIIFFEPNNQNFNILVNNIGDDKRVHCHNIALGPFEGTATFHTCTGNEGQSNSILQPNLHTSQYPHIVFNGISTVPVQTLDSFGLSPEINLLNIDVQGFELNVFLGASKTLRNIDYIYTEVNRAEVYHNCAHVEDLDYFLGKYGFKRVETSWDGETWGDALYIKG